MSYDVYESARNSASKYAKEAGRYLGALKSSLWFLEHYQKSECRQERDLNFVIEAIRNAIGEVADDSR